jgi:GT2 family glycosyltransferase
VHSLLASTVALRIVVVDTTPHDPELAAALAFAPEIALLRPPTNCGFGGGTNMGLNWAQEQTECKYLLVLNNDTVVEPGTVVRLEQALDRDAGVGIATPRIGYMDEPARLWYGGGEIDWRRASGVTPGFNGPVDAPLALKERDVSFASGCAMLLRHAVLASLGGFDARYFMYEEDVELCLRARWQGVRIRYVPAAFLLHRAQGASATGGPLRMDFWSCARPQLPFYAFHIVRNRLHTIHLHARGLDALTAAICFPLYLMRRALPFAWGGRWDAILAMGRGAAAFWCSRTRRR